MQIKTTTLKNGLRVVLVDTQTFPSLTMLLLVGAGSRFENQKNNGIAHFFEHMAFKGSQKYPTALQIATLLDSIGSEHNAFTSKDHTGYWIKAPTKYFETSLDILSQMILQPLLKEEEIQREKGVIIEEINMYEDQPQYKVLDLFENLLYPNHPLGYDIVGKKQTVSRFTRQTFLEYMKNLYQPSNVVLVVAGGLSQARHLTQNQMSSLNYYLQTIEKKFSSWSDGQKALFLEFKDKQNLAQSLIKTKKTEQAHLVLGFRGLDNRHPERYVQAVLMTILGGGMSSRLFYEVRERRGLCYYIQSSAETFADTGYVFTRAGLTTNIEKIKEAVKVILAEHEKIAAGQLEEKELEKAKEMLKGRLLLSFEDSNNLASFVGRKLMFEEKLVTPDEVIAQINQVDKEAIIRLAKKIFQPKKLNLAVIGPVSKKDLQI